MKASLRISVLSLIAAAALAACAARQGASLLPAPSTHALAGTRQVLPFVRPVDAGRRPAAARVSAVLLMRYNHQGELDRFIAGLVGATDARYLTRDEFVRRFALTSAQQQHAIDVLRANGFTVDRTFANRTTIDVSAPTATFERFFATEVHDFNQGKYGPRYANITPIRIPKELNAYVSAVTASSVVVRHPDSILVASPPTAAPAGHSEAPDAAANVIKNPGFETGKLKPSWTTCASNPGAAPNASIEKLHPHGGKFDAYAGTFQNQREPQALMAVCQTLTLPNSAKLTFFTWGVSNDKKRVYQFAGIYDPSTGKPIKQVWRSNSNDKKWQSRSANLSAYAGKKVALLFGVYGNAKHKGKVIGLFVDDVTLTGIKPTPEPATVPCPTPNATPTPSFANNDGWGPQSIQDGFCMPVNYGYSGTGQTAAIVIDKEVNPSDLSAWLAAFNITRTGAPVVYSRIDGAPPTTDDEGEATLDLETIAGLAPGANIVVYVTGDLADMHIEDAYQAALTDVNHPGVVNSSFGGCEEGSTAGGFDATSNALAQQGAAEGVTFAASSGDQGSDCYYDGTKWPFGVQGPASDPYFVSVGGTQSTVPYFTSYDICSSGSAVPAKITNPVAWSDCVGAGGGGISKQWAMPSYQSGLGATTKRNVPDIALPAVEDAICFSGGSGGGCIDLYGVYEGFGMIWGTSWSSPIYVAMQTEINQACGSHQWGISTVYNALKKNSYRHFIDVTGGNNQWLSPNGGAQFYAAGIGFDQTSGIGIPMGMQLATDRCNKPAIVRHGK